MADIVPTDSKGRKLTESKIQSKILAWLRDSGLVYWRQNSGQLWMGNRMVNMGPPGLPDIVVIVPPTGRFLGLEVKSQEGKLRPAQVEMMHALKEAGAAYEVVRSLDDVFVVLGRHLSQNDLVRCHDMVRQAHMAELAALREKRKAKRKLVLK